MPAEFWSIPVAQLLRHSSSSPHGLSSAEAKQRLQRAGQNRIAENQNASDIKLFLSQFSSPLILLLLGAAILAFFLGDAGNSIIILVIVIASGALGFWQERGAVRAIEKLRAMVATQVTVLRDGREQRIPLAETVVGDVVILSAGDTVPGDCRVLEAKDLLADEAALTGEPYPVHKRPGLVSPGTPFMHRTNALFMGTHVVSGTGKALIARTGVSTQFGQLSQRLQTQAPETEFERGIRTFGYFLLQVTILLAAAVFVINLLIQRPILESALFSLAIAVGLAPELLPAITTISLAHGAKKMAEKKVIVKRLSSIPNFGSMNVLCCDKTGTLTEGVVRVHSTRDAAGALSEKTLLYAYLNAAFQEGFSNPVDDAIKLRAKKRFDTARYHKLDEVPYDFTRKRLSVLLKHGNKHIMVTKGAVPNVLAACSRVEIGGKLHPISRHAKAIAKQYAELGEQGFRTLAIAVRDVAEDAITRKDESGMTLIGILVLFDPPKPGIAQTLSRLSAQGIALKMITGDNKYVAAAIAEEAGMRKPRVMVSREVERLSDQKLQRIVGEIDVFAEIEPQQKERVILALKAAGNVVGYLGDGINDAPALHTADVGISVNTAVDVAKEAADIVLLEKDLGVLVQGVREGRTTFANTMKYVFMATSANFGNMFSMAGASLVLPFLPMLPKQILLTNLFSDFPEITIARDSVDAELVERPRRWDIKFIKKFMIVFGLLSSVFDVCTFVALRWVMRSSPAQFQTGWFFESVVSAALIVLVIRTRRPLVSSKPSLPLFIATMGIIALTALLPFTPLAPIFGFVPVPLKLYAYVGLIILGYIVCAEIAKSFFYKCVQC